MEISKYYEVNKGALLGFASVYIPKWKFFINNVGVCQKNGHRWINFPNRKYTDETGQDKYAAYCGFENRELKEVFEKEFLAALDEYLKKNPQEQLQPEPVEECPF